MGSPEGEGTVTSLIKEGLSGRGLPPRRVRRKCRKCGICPQEEEEAGFSLRLGQSLDPDFQSMQNPPQSASLESPTGPQTFLSSKDIGEPGGSWAICVPEAELENLLFSKNVAQSDSLDHFFGFPGLFGGEPLSPVTQDSPLSPALYPAVLTGDSTEQQEVQPLFVVGSPGTPLDPERSEVKAHPESRMRPGQGLTAPADSCASSSEPLGGLSDASLGQRSPRRVKKRRWESRVSCAQKQCTDNSSGDRPEEASGRGCSSLVS